MSCQRRMLIEADREEISRGITDELEGQVIAARIGRCYAAPIAVRRDATTHATRWQPRRPGCPARWSKPRPSGPGSDLAAHAAFSLATEVAVYFAHPHSPWQRGTNENTNGLLREYFPKSTEITDDQTYLDCVAAELNNRPRRILGYRTPAEVFADLLASSIASTG